MILALYHVIRYNADEEFRTCVCYLSSEEKGMDYKMEIIGLLEKVQSQDILKRVYKLLEYLYIREEPSI